jgi:hypothetical protein
VKVCYHGRPQRFDLVRVGIVVEDAREALDTSTPRRGYEIEHQRLSPGPASSSRWGSKHSHPRIASPQLGHRHDPIDRARAAGTLRQVAKALNHRGMADTGSSRSGWRGAPGVTRALQRLLLRYRAYRSAAPNSGGAGE